MVESIDEITNIYVNAKVDKKNPQYMINYAMEYLDAIREGNLHEDVIDKMKEKYKNADKNTD